MHQWIISIQLMLLPLAALGVETPVPERFLAPRHFNPHPITDVRRPAASYKQLRIPEPVDVYAHYLQHREPAYKGQEFLQYAPQQQRSTHAQFSEQQQQQASEHQYARADTSHLYAATDSSHQYAATAAQLEDTHAHHYEAQTQHEAHVQHNYLSTSQHHRTDSYDEHVPKQYAFSYSVLDHHSGDDFSHKQKHDGHSTEGQYRVKLPDGRTQVVKYTADKGGYRAKVTYEPAEVAVVVHPSPAYLKPRDHYQQYVSTTYPSVEYKSATPAPPRFYKHHDLTVATTYPALYSQHQYEQPSVHIGYNGGHVESSIEPSHQVYEQHNVYKRTN